MATTVHFSNGNFYGPSSPTGPGTAIVDPFANILADGAGVTALELNSGPWTVTINGSVRSNQFYAVELSISGSFVSNLAIGRDGDVFAGGFGAILAMHPTNITNSGRITGPVNSGIAITEGGSGNYAIKNLKSGLIEGFNGIQIFGTGVHTIVNAGTISTPISALAIDTHEGAEHVTNWGRISGQISLGDGNDIFTNFHKVGRVIKNGITEAQINLGEGNDTFNGGSAGEIVQDAGGKDTINLGRGADQFFGVLGGGTDLADRIDGGKGIDTYVAPPGFSAVSINLDTVTHTDSIYGRTVAANLAHDAVNASNPGDRILKFENATGGLGADSIFGTKGANVLSGSAGADHLYGFGGKDTLTGGSEADIFVFTSLKDSGPTKATRDTITDFEGAGVGGGDVIDLSAINAQLGNVHFIGTTVDFDSSAGAVRAVWVGSETIVQLDKDGDKDADFSIALSGNLTLDADFGL